DANALFFKSGRNVDDSIGAKRMANQNHGRARVLALVGKYPVQHKTPCLMALDTRIDAIGLQLPADLVYAGGEDVPEPAQKIDIRPRGLPGRRFWRCLCRAAIKRKSRSGKDQAAAGHDFRMQTIGL